MSFVVYRDDGNTRNLEPNVLVYTALYIMVRQLLMSLIRQKVLEKGKHYICH